jgi:hypothetical protein
MRGARGETLLYDYRSVDEGESEIMISQSLLPTKAEFHSSSPENYLLVENDLDGSVVIRAAVDNYPEERKALFIRKLALEGFIPDRFQSVDNANKSPGVRWIVDNSWLTVAAEAVVVSWRGVWGMYLDRCMGAALAVSWRNYRHWC